MTTGPARGSLLALGQIEIMPKTRVLERAVRENRDACGPVLDLLANAFSGRNRVVEKVLGPENVNGAVTQRRTALRHGPGNVREEEVLLLREVALVNRP